MPLSKTININDITIYVWHITESPEDLLSLLLLQDSLADIEMLKNFKAVSRQQEALVERLLIYEHFKNHQVSLCHRKNGSPYLLNANQNISISHTKGWVALALSGKANFGIDIETIASQQRVSKIKDYFMTPFEYPQGEDVSHLYQLVVWCAKESVFKSQVNGVVNSMKDDYIPFFELREEGFFPAFFQGGKSRNEVGVTYYINQSYVLTVADACGVIP